MRMTLLLLNERGDELGRLPLLTVRLVAAGVETAPPDLASDMAQTSERIGVTLAEEGMACTLSHLDLRLAVSRALLAPSDEEIKVPIPVRFLGGDKKIGPARQPNIDAGITQAGTAATPLIDEWDDLFALDDNDRPDTDVLEGDFE